METNSMDSQNLVEENQPQQPADPLSQIKHDLEGWREVLLPLNNLLNWDKPVYPGIIIGFTTFLFLMIWYFEPSVLTTFSLLGLSLSLIDFLVPLVGPSVLGRSKWTGVQEKQYEQICIRILNFRYHISDVVDTMVTLKNERPKVYFMLVMGFLALFAWVGSKIDNLLLTFLMLNLTLLMPGMRRQKVIQGYLNKIGAVFKKTVLGKSKSK
ncbi:ADP-ribosylation factor-like protein 6-interacting protein 1 [Mercenaria mercenaria]|uniref:ADP-ribosylation factor-like protein 6-interacting protein 1 n=1 Tax=Mercenaria mercenaria TaxID=6596 RepID=UPI001E1DE494|nr:ADP-ribosylation factor-like protein 6-interacting protein 1 [Mercenaria mercenaria]